MTVYELGAKLAEMYHAPGANKTTMIHLFGVMYADEIKAAGTNATEVIKASGLPESYVTEVHKGMRLSQYVSVKPQYIEKY